MFQVEFAELKGQELFIMRVQHSKWVEVFPMQNTTPGKVLGILRKCSSCGFPEEIFSDNGPKFISEEVRHFIYT